MTAPKLSSFEGKILFFNGMYKLAIAAFPSAGAVIADEKKRYQSLDDNDLVRARLAGFKQTIFAEITEVDDIMTQLGLGFKIDPKTKEPTTEEYKELDFLVDLADWLGDIQVYCASEMVKFGLPIAEILSIIMASNFSKLQADGTTLYDENGKVQKGPGYWKPEPQIKQLLEEYIANAPRIQTEKQEAEKNGIITPEAGE